MSDDMAALIRAMDEQRRVVFRYEGLQRLVEPYCLCRTSEGSLVLTGWQVAGLGTGWRTFQAGSLNALRLTELVFDGQRTLSVLHDSSSEVLHCITCPPTGGV